MKGQYKSFVSLSLSLLVETLKVLFVCGLKWLVAEDSATLEDRDLVHRQAGVLALHLEHPEDLPPIGLTCDREAALSIVPGQHQQLAPHGLEQSFHLLQMPILRTDVEAAGSIVRGQSACKSGNTATSARGSSVTREKPRL